MQLKPRRSTAHAVSLLVAFSCAGCGDAGDSEATAGTELRSSSAALDAVPTVHAHLFALSGTFDVPDLLLSGDFDADQRPDLLGRHGTGVRTGFVEANGLITPVDWPSPSLHDDALTGDFDGDGRSDFFQTGTIQQGSGTFVSFEFGRSRGRDSFALSVTLGDPLPFWQRFAAHGNMASGDFDGLGHDQIAFATMPDDGSIYTLTRADNDWVYGYHELNGDVASWNSMLNRSKTLAADFDGDGVDDMALFPKLPNLSVVPIAYSNRTGTFTVGALPRAQFPVWRLPSSLLAGDFDHNGSADIASVNGAGDGSVGVALSKRDRTGFTSARLTIDDPTLVQNAKQVFTARSQGLDYIGLVAQSGAVYALVRD